MAFQLAGSVTVQESSTPTILDTSNYGVDTRHDIGDFRDLYRIFYMDMDENIIHKQAISLDDGWADELISLIPTVDSVGYQSTVDAIWKMGIVALPTVGTTWYLPSRDELIAMADNLHAEGVGDFDIYDEVLDLAADDYWSSSQKDADTSYAVSIGSGGYSSFGEDKGNGFRIRPIRHFTAPEGAYELRDRGPEGGWIFYIDGTTYYEAAERDLLEADGVGSSEAWPVMFEDGRRSWSYNPTYASVAGTGTAIGTGYNNTLLMINRLGDSVAHDANAYSYTDDTIAEGDHYVENDGAVGLNIVKVDAGDVRTIIGTISSSPVVGTEMVDDWYLPSKDELNEIHTNLWSMDYGSLTEGSYWSSSESSASNAWRQAFINSVGDGAAIESSKDTEYRIRPVRKFTAAEGAYSLRDRGPLNGWIFYIDGTTYYEAAPEDITAATWSNVTSTAVTGTGTAIGTGEDNTSAIVDQAEHTASAAQDTLDYSIEILVTDDTAVDDLATWSEVKALLPSSYYVDLDIGVTKANLQSILSELLYRATVTNKAITKDHRTLFNDPDWLEAAKLYLDSVAIDQLIIDNRYDAAQVILDRAEVVTNKYSV